jgi:hypothetical protein
VSVFFGLFLTVILYNRLDFTISKDDKWAAGRERDALAGSMEQIQSVLEGA